MRKHVGTQAIGHDLDGRDADQPWSAAAISFIVRHAAERFPLYRKFRFSAAHARYIHDAVRKREVGNMDTPFWVTACMNAGQTWVI